MFTFERRASSTMYDINSNAPFVPFVRHWQSCRSWRLKHLWQAVYFVQKQIVTPLLWCQSVSFQKWRRNNLVSQFSLYRRQRGTRRHVLALWLLSAHIRALPNMVYILLPKGTKRRHIRSKRHFMSLTRGVLHEIASFVNFLKFEHVSSNFLAKLWLWWFKNGVLLDWHGWDSSYYIRSAR